MPLFIDPAKAHWVLPVENAELKRLRALEARHAALREAVAWERECDECGEWLHRAWWDRNELDLGEIEDLYDCARAEVDRLLDEK